jgi:hypothetical protein
MAIVGWGALGWLLLFSSIPVCPMAGFFGIPCPGCGMSRATHALLLGDIHQAFAMHPLVFVILPLLTVFAGHRLWGYSRGVNVELGAVLEPARESEHARRRRRIINLVLLLIASSLFLVWGIRFCGYLGGPAPVESWWKKGETLGSTR